MAKEKNSKSKSKIARQESARKNKEIKHAGADPIQNLGEARQPHIGNNPPGIDTIIVPLNRYIKAMESKQQQEREKRMNEQARRERFKEICPKYYKLLANSKVRTYWIEQAGEAMKKESDWQGATLNFKREKGHKAFSGRGLRYDSFEKDKGLIYALMGIALDIWSSIRILPDELRESKFYYLNSAIVPDIINMGLAEEYLAYIEADLSEQGLWPIVTKEKTETYSGKKRRKSKAEKIGIIAAYYKENPGAKSSEIENSTGIDATDVRHLWGPIKQKLQEVKRTKPEIDKKTGEPIDRSASCNICQVPLSDSFECNLCKKTIIGECKTCHFTNTHPADAFP